MKTASEKASAAVTSINEQYKISEGIANAVLVVEKKSKPPRLTWIDFFFFFFFFFFSCTKVRT